MTNNILKNVLKCIKASLSTQMSFVQREYGNFLRRI